MSRLPGRFPGYNHPVRQAGYGHGFYIIREDKVAPFQGGTGLGCRKRAKLPRGLAPSVRVGWPCVAFTSFRM